MAFIGYSDGFSQRHYSNTKSYYCPDWAIKEDGGVVRSPIKLKGTRKQKKKQNSVRSPIKLKDIRKDIKKYSGSSKPRFDDELLDEVIRDCFYAFRLPTRVRPIHLNDLVTKPLNNWGSSPGFPWGHYGYKTRKEVAMDKYAFNSIRFVWHQVKEGHQIRLPYCGAFVIPDLVERGRMKVRAAYGYPCTVSFQEACFALPLIDAYKNIKTPMVHGFEISAGDCRKIFTRFANYKNFVSSDFQNFEKTIPAWLIRVAFDILLYNLDLTLYQYCGLPNTAKLYIVWKKLVDYFISTPIRMCNGERYKKNKGVASGSYFTQLVGSIVNYIVTQYCIRSHGAKIHDMLVLNDHSLVATDKRIDVTLIAATAEKFGMFIKKTNQVARIQEVEFLGYAFTNGDPLRDIQSLCAALLHHEHPDRDFNNFTTLALKIANFGADVEFHCMCGRIPGVPYKATFSPSLTRYLTTLGIDQLPKQPPELFRLQLCRFRS